MCVVCVYVFSQTQGTKNPIMKSNSVDKERERIVKEDRDEKKWKLGKDGIPEGYEDHKLHGISMN